MTCSGDSQRLSGCVRGEDEGRQGRGAGTGGRDAETGGAHLPAG